MSETVQYWAREAGMDWHTLGDVHYRKRVLYQVVNSFVNLASCYLAEDGMEYQHF